MLESFLGILNGERPDEGTTVTIHIPLKLPETRAAAG